MKTLLITSTAIMLFATPASAQLLGGGGLTGGLGGSLGGTLGGSMGQIGGMTGGTLSGAARTSGSQHVDRKSGSVAADRSVGGTLGGTVGQTLDTPARSVTGSASADGSADAGVNGNAQLIGTDAVRGTVASTRSAVDGTTRSAVGEVKAAANGTAKATGEMAAGGNGTAQGSGGGAGSLGGSGLAAAGSGAAAATGGFAVAPGMDIRSASGQAIGSVRQVVADAHGNVQSLLVEVDNRTATLPASNFSADGDALVSAMGSGEIRKAAQRQAGGNPDGASTENSDHGS